MATVLAVATFAFLFRFNTLNGLFGGFSDDHFPTLARVELLIAGEQPLRDFAESELRGAWPSLSYQIPAWAQQIGGRTFYPEALLTIGALAVSHALVFWLGFTLSGRWWLGLLAAATAIASGPKLYNYPKVLVLVLVAMCLRAIARHTSWRSLGAAAVVTAVAILFRHDYGVYASAGIVATLAARHWGTWSAMLRHLTVYGVLTTCALAPSIAWVQRYEGVATYIRKAATSVRAETGRTPLTRPSLSAVTDGDRDGLVASTYYAHWLVPALALVTLVAARRVSTDAARVVQWSTTAGLLALSVVVNHYFLRANLSQRFGDAIVPVVLLAASLGRTSLEREAMRHALTLAAGAALTAMLFALATVNEMPHQLQAAGLTTSWSEVHRVFGQVRNTLEHLPPADDWSRAGTDPEFLAARYLRECTSPQDYALVTGYSSEVLVLAQRRFAAGQGTMSLGFYTAEDDQRRALATLEKQSVPIVLADAQEFEAGFRSDYPILANHVLTRYREAGTIPASDAPRFRVFVDSARTATRAHPVFHLPCFQ